MFLFEREKENGAAYMEYQVTGPKKKSLITTKLIDQYVKVKVNEIRPQEPSKENKRCSKY